jgi:hypothetical protein
MSTLLRLSPLKPLRHLRNGTPLGASFDLRATTRLTNGPTQFAHVFDAPHPEGQVNWTNPSSEGDLPSLQLTTRTAVGVTRGPRVNVTSRRQIE